MREWAGARLALQDVDPSPTVRTDHPLGAIGVTLPQEGGRGPVRISIIDRIARTRYTVFASTR